MDLKKIASVSLLAVAIAACGSDDEDRGEWDAPYMAFEEEVLPGSQADFAIEAGDRAFYAFDMYNLNAESQETIERQAEWLKAYDDVDLSISGHCDERGTQEYNLALGQRRADSHKNYLVALGIDPRRIETISYGKERPIVEGSTEAAYAQNRTTIITLDQ
ncbi:MAG: peptidoglycan-associated lipoprotein Pal [Alphaproteobacteria bacterium]|jgi:peptidoglycan-associated lipoprotein|nr:peptidoglycan-associated lipoprotein Pal [Alphaproteobacteria bacterium]MBT5390566.1 peptidoglycan-associated lipoprotein Pal [Alphaproteobacteria bacterium]MBT5540925.1 peptidoglycan-associated lipoprotein Pal [Alphaproteobacteria bacterium]MBT5654345.1 peptidoglycan-associated lipoprotein Pal [Alphaproteobacteria bacterium]